MRHDARGWWIDDAGPPAALPAQAGDLEADVVVVGGGFTGLWAAWHVLEARPGARVAVLEADRCGFGPSGRNGGFVQSMDLSRPMLVERFGAQAADALAAAARDSVRAIGAWCEAAGVDAWFRAAPHLVVSAAPAQDGVGARAVDGRTVLALSADEVRARCASPVMRGGVVVPVGATVHPARLAFGLRRALLDRGALIFEGSRVRGLDDGTARTDGGRVRAPVALIAAGASTGTLPALRRSLTVSSSHIVLTEPVPDVIEDIGWTGGEAISDGRTLLHYLRTTADGRILFGWAGGRMAAGARPDGRMEVDPEVIERTRADLVRFFPALEGRRVERAWGGPIDVSPTHLPIVRTLAGGRAHAAFGFTGNGVGPSHLVGRALADLALGADAGSAAAGLAIVNPAVGALPPEPLRVIGAAAIRRALVAKEAAEQDGRRPPALARAVAAVPARMGVHIVR